MMLMGTMMEMTMDLSMRTMMSMSMELLTRIFVNEAVDKDDAERVPEDDAGHVDGHDDVNDDPEHRACSRHRS